MSFSWLMQMKNSLLGMCLKKMKNLEDSPMKPMKSACFLRYRNEHCENHCLRTDMVRVKLTLTRGEDSTADVIVVPQETTFTGSHLMDHNGETWRIRAIHTGAGRTLRGTVKAPDIKRMYLHEPPNPEHFTPRTP